MGLWNNYLINKLPDELQADVIKHQTSELENTRRTKVRDRDYNMTVRVIVVFLFLIVVVVCITVGSIVTDMHH